MIIQSGIKTVVYLSDEKANQLKTRAAERMFIAADVTFRY
jgi:deoxycytidylate deaminase